MFLTLNIEESEVLRHPNDAILQEEDSVIVFTVPSFVWHRLE